MGLKGIAKLDVTFIQVCALSELVHSTRESSYICIVLLPTVMPVFGLTEPVSGGNIIQSELSIPRRSYSHAANIAVSRQQTLCPSLWFGNLTRSQRGNVGVRCRREWIVAEASSFQEWDRSQYVLQEKRAMLLLTEFCFLTPNHISIPPVNMAQSSCWSIALMPGINSCCWSSGFCSIAMSLLAKSRSLRDRMGTPDFPMLSNFGTVRWEIGGSLASLESDKLGSVSRGIVGV